MPMPQMAIRRSSSLGIDACDSKVTEQALSSMVESATDK